MHFALIFFCECRFRSAAGLTRGRGGPEGEGAGTLTGVMMALREFIDGGSSPVREFLRRYAAPQSFYMCPRRGQGSSSGTGESGALWLASPPFDLAEELSRKPRSKRRRERWVQEFVTKW